MLLKENLGSWSNTSVQDDVSAGHFGRCCVLHTGMTTFCKLSILQFVSGMAEAIVFAVGGGLQAEKLASTLTQKLSIVRTYFPIMTAEVKHHLGLAQ